MIWLTKRVSIVVMGDDRARRRLIKALELSGVVSPLLSAKTSERLGIEVLNATVGGVDVYIYALSSTVTEAIIEHYCRLSSVAVIIADLEDPMSCAKIPKFVRHVVEANRERRRALMILAGRERLSSSDMLALERLCERYAQALARRLKRRVDFAVVSYSDTRCVRGILEKAVKLALSER